MAMVGCLGEIVFRVSSDAILTLNNFKWSGSAKYATHQRHSMNSLTEFVGVDPDKISFNIVVSAYLGVDPQEEINKLWKYERNGIAVALILGNKAYGKYRWNVTAHSVTAQYFDGYGNLTSASVSVTLQEYLRE